MTGGAVSSSEVQSAGSHELLAYTNSHNMEGCSNINRETFTSLSLPLPPSIHPSIPPLHPPITKLIYPSVHQCFLIPSFTHTFLIPSIKLVFLSSLISPSIYFPINPFPPLSIHSFIHPSFIHPFSPPSSPSSTSSISTPFHTSFHPSTL